MLKFSFSICLVNVFVFVVLLLFLLLLLLLLLFFQYLFPFARWGRGEHWTSSIILHSFSHQLILTLYLKINPRNQN